MSADASPPIIVFDGVCVLCNGWVRFLLRHDRKGVFRFAAVQTLAGRALMLANALDPDDPTSFLLLDEAGAWVDTAGIIRVLRRLDMPFAAAGAMLQCMPARLRDAAYRLLARKRYRWFGRHAQCLIPPAGTQHRFIG